MKLHLLSPLLICLAASCVSHTETPLSIDLIDTRVGTDYATTATAGMFGKGSEEHGQTLPAVGVPHGMNLWTPQTRDTELKCIAPYYYQDSLFQGFRNSHWVNGGCTQDYGSMTLHAMSGKLRTTPTARATLFHHDTETARPDYYWVDLPDEGIQAEMTGLSRSGLFRFSYSKPGEAHIVVNANSDEGVGYVEYDPASHEILGYNPIHRIYQGWGEPSGHSGWFIVKLPEGLNITDYGTFRNDTINSGATSITGNTSTGVYITFDAEADKPLLLSAGSSFTSLDGARRNLEAEIPVADFDKVRSQSTAAWQQRLDCIKVEGGSDTDRRKFYGSLYRCSLLPRIISDVDGAYPKFASGKEIMHTQEGREMYDDFSMWDTYRALHPLLTLIDPQRSGDMMQSLVTKAEEGGWMPIFPCWNSYTAAMIGDHCTAAIADAAVKGVGNFDLETAYRYLRQNAFDTPATYEEYKDGMGRRALKSYLQYGYIPLEDGVEEAFHKQEQTSRTLEYAFDDFALAQIATKLGVKDDAGELLRRSKNYRNVIDPTLGYANGRHADGTFEIGTDPFDFNRAITEGAPCHYTWYAPHDPDGLIELLGGKEKFVAKLDSMFTQGRYWHGNEPCHQVAYMFNYAGRPDLTRKWVRHILDTEYLNEPGGLSGNDDAGQMSAWYVFSAMGFYPVCPATDSYELGYPLFDRITITPAADVSSADVSSADVSSAEVSSADVKPFVITAKPDADSTVSATSSVGNSSVKFNGWTLPEPRITHTALKNGGSLNFE